jgi:hypothetical protein
MTHTQLEHAVKINKAIQGKKQQLETFKEMMNFGGALPSKIKVSNGDAPYMPVIIENKVVAMVVLDTILEQFNNEIEALELTLESI